LGGRWVLRTRLGIDGLRPTSNQMLLVCEDQLLHMPAMHQQNGLVLWLVVQDNPVKNSPSPLTIVPAMSVEATGITGRKLLITFLAVSGRGWVRPWVGRMKSIGDFETLYGSSQTVYDF